jgi:hypothetical protein
MVSMGKLVVIEQRSSAFKHNVVSVLEVMGGDADHFA